MRLHTNSSMRSQASSRLSSRRSFLQGTALAFASPLVRMRRQFDTTLRAKVESICVISRQPQHYHGWPTLARRHNGQLLLVYSGGREAHVCPFGRVELMRSNDNGQTWTWPQVLLD